MTARRFATTALLTGFVLLAVALPAQADVTGGCDGEAVIEGVTYTPANDTASNPVVIPDEGGVLIPWDGSAPFDNNGHAGGLRLHLGPAAIEVADWADDNGPLPNESSADGVYALDDFRDQLPFPVRGLYRVSGEHVATGACQGFVMLKFDGPPLVSPVAQGAAGTVVVGLLLLALAALATKSAGAAGLVRGRRVLGVVAGLLFGVSLAVLLQQASIWPLDNLTTIALPLVAAILGFLLGNWAPLRRGRLAASITTTGAEVPEDVEDFIEEVEERGQREDRAEPVEDEAGAESIEDGETADDVDDVFEFIEELEAREAAAEGLPEPGGRGDGSVIDVIDEPGSEWIEVGDAPAGSTPPLVLPTGKDPCWKLRARIARQGELLEEAEKDRRKFEERVKELEKQLEEFEKRHRKGLDREDAQRRAGVRSEFPLTERRRELQNELGLARDLAEGLLKKVTIEDFEQELERLRECEKRVLEAALHQSRLSLAGGDSSANGEKDGETPCCESRLWYGINIYFGGHAVLWGPEEGLVFLWCADSSRSAVVKWSGSRWGPGLGGELSAAVIVLNGPHHPYETPAALAKVLSGFDWDVSVGLSVKKVLGALGKGLTSAKDLKRLGKELVQWLGRTDPRSLTGNKALMRRAQQELSDMANPLRRGSRLDGAIDSAAKGATSGAQAGGTGANIPIPIPTALQIGVWKLTSVTTTLIDVAGCRACDPASVPARPV